MKRRWWAISLAMGWCLVASCFATAEEKAAGPNLVMKERFFNFMEVREGEVIEHTFTVLNDGTEPLVIEEVRPG